jgi:hypothetical protein
VSGRLAAAQSLVSMRPFVLCRAGGRQPTPDQINHCDERNPKLATRAHTQVTHSIAATAAARESVPPPPPPLPECRDSRFRFHRQRRPLRMTPPDRAPSGRRRHSSAVRSAAALQWRLSFVCTQHKLRRGRSSSRLGTATDGRLNEPDESIGAREVGPARPCCRLCGACH